MKKYLFIVLALFGLLSTPASAQQPQALIVTTCGTPPISYVAGTYGILTMDVNGKLCDGGSGGGGTVIANQGTAGSNAQAWWMQIGDGTHGPAAVKPASTAPAATDPSLVVAISPNSVNANGQATAANSSPVVLPAAQVTADPCSLNTKTNFTISTTSGTLQIVAPSGSTQVYICSLLTIGATASIQNIVGGTGATCTTGTPVAIAGSTTAANGMSFAANGGFTFGNGAGTVLRTTTAGHGVCLIQNGTAQISGGGTFVQQ